ncbi:unnamed protein product, partial [Didymodactylos carnosus]
MSVRAYLNELPDQQVLYQFTENLQSDDAYRALSSFHMQEHKLLQEIRKMLEKRILLDLD